LKLQHGSVSVSCSPDWSCFVSGSWDGFVRIFKIEIGREVDVVFEHHSSKVYRVASSAGMRMIATASLDGTVKLWDPMTASCTRTLRVDSPLLSVAFRPDSSLLAVGGISRAVQMWSLHDHTLITTLNGHTGDVNDIKFSLDGRRMVSLSLYHEIILWDIEKQERLAHLPETTTAREYGSRVLFSADETCIVLQFHNAMKRWKIVPNGKYSFEQAVVGSQSSESLSEAILLPMLLVPTPDDVHIIPHDYARPYHQPLGSEWIVDQGGRRVCWIPADRRLSDSHGNKVFLGTMSGRFVVVDLSDLAASQQ